MTYWDVYATWKRKKLERFNDMSPRERFEFQEDVNYYSKQHFLKYVGEVYFPWVGVTTFLVLLSMVVRLPLVTFCAAHYGESATLQTCLDSAEAVIPTRLMATVVLFAMSVTFIIGLVGHYKSAEQMRFEIEEMDDDTEWHIHELKEDNEKLKRALGKSKRR